MQEGPKEQPAELENDSPPSGEDSAFLSGTLRVYNEDEVLRRPLRQRSAHWSIAWSDLMMTMFIFFAVLYIYQASDHRLDENWQAPEPRYQGGRQEEGFRPEGGGFFEEDRDSSSSVYSMSREIIKADNLGDFADVQLTPDEAIRFTLTNDLLFSPGDATLHEDAGRSLGRIAELLKKTSLVINVVGHTDPAPINNEKFPSNWELSVLRATAVTRFLIERGVAADRFFVSGHAYYQPLTSNDTSRNRSINRRVEIILMKEKPVY